MRKEKLEELKSYVEELKTIKREVDVKPKKQFTSSIAYKYYLNNGRVIPREQVLKNGIDGSAVLVVPVVKETGEILVVIEPRVFTSLGVGVSFPAGYIEKNEEPEAAALRELKEETGYVPEKLIHLDSFYQDEGVSAAYNHAFLALNSTKKFEQELGENEIVKYMTFTLEELDELEKLGYICGANGKLTFCRTKEYLKEME